MIFLYICFFSISCPLCNESNAFLYNTLVSTLITITSRSPPNVLYYEIVLYLNLFLNANLLLLNTKNIAFYILLYTLLNY